jgi:hypothetical protein
MGGKKPKGKQGFAAMDPEKHKAIASMGGRAAHQLGVAHEFTSAEAKAAGAKGGFANKNQYRFTSEKARATSLKGWAKKKKGQRSNSRGRPRRKES